MTMNTNSESAAQYLAPEGVLRVALNLSNFLLVSGKTPAGEWRGVAPDLARALAQALGVQVEYVAYDAPGKVIAAADSGAWAVAFVGADPARAGSVVFADPYVEIEAGYLVPPGSLLQHVDDVDRPGRRVCAFRGSAYELWLASHLAHASLVHGDTFDASFSLFRQGHADVLAGLMPKLLSDRESWPGSRILQGAFMRVQQSVGTAMRNRGGADFVQQFVRDAKASGLVARLIEQHKIVGLKVAAAQPT